ncbi:MAG: TonB family protein [Polyangiaceae bacterium]
MSRPGLARWLTAGALAATFTSLAPAQAQPPPPAPPSPSAASPPPAPPSPVVEMPQPLTPLTATYPEGATGDAEVILKLVVNADGTVGSAEVARGKEPFTSAALAAARTYRFIPAKRDAVPIRAAIRVLVKFTAPADPAQPANPQPANPQPANPQTANPQTANPQTANPQTANPQTANPQTANPQTGNSQTANPQPGSSSPPDPSAPPDPAAPPEPIDVSVRGLVAPPGATSMSRAEVRLLPGAFGDPFRAVEALPGVTPIASGLPYFFVRGAPPGNVGYLLDGIRVPLLYHLGLGPSVIHPAIVDRVDLHPGGYPASFGRFAGAIVSGETRDSRPDLNGEAQIRIVDAGAMVEVPFPDGRGSAMAGGRYSYTGLLFSILQSDLRLDYWDYQARVTYEVAPTHTLTLFAFGARDFLGDKDPDTAEDRTLVDTTFHRVDLRHEKRLGPDEYLRNAFTFGWDETGFNGGGTRDLMLATRTQLKLHPTPQLTFRAGTDATLDHLRTTLSSASIGGGDSTGDDIPIELSSRYDLYAGAWADAVLHITDTFEVTPGLRLDFYGSTGPQGGSALSVEPRLSSVLHLRPWLRLVQAHGLASQRPSFFIPGPGFTPNFTGGLLQRSFQSSAGVEADIPLDIEAKLTLFRSAFFDMTDAFGTSTFTDLVTPESYSQRSLGTATGLEVSLRRRMTKRIGGFLSYTLSHSERALGRNHFRSATNRTHVLNLALGVDIWRGLRAGVRAVVYTGYPEIIRHGRGSPPIDTGRDLPTFFRLDQRLEKRWSLGGTKWVSLVIEMQNSTLSTEVLGIRCDGDGPEACQPLEIGPVAIPSIGVEGGI